MIYLLSRDKSGFNVLDLRDILCLDVDNTKHFYLLFIYDQTFFDISVFIYNILRNFAKIDLSLDKSFSVLCMLY